MYLVFLCLRRRSVSVDAELVEEERRRCRRRLVPREDSESDEVDECLRRRCLFRRRWGAERFLREACLSRDDVEEEDDVDLCLFVRARFPRGDLDLEREVEMCFFLLGRLPRGDLDLGGDAEVDGAGDPSPRVDGLCGTEVKPVVTPTS